MAERCGDLWEQATAESKRMQHGYVGVEHVFNAMARQQGGWLDRLLLAVGMDPSAVRDAIRREVGTGAAMHSGDPTLTPRLLDVLDRAERLLGMQESIVELGLLGAILEEGQSLPVRYLASMGHSAVDLLSRLRSLVAGATPPNAMEGSEKTIISSDPTLSTSMGELPGPTVASVPGPKMAPHTAVPVSLPTPTLDKLGRDLAKLARMGKLAEAVGREEEIEQIIVVLARTQKSNPLLLGEAGVGKTAIIEGLAWRIAQGSVPAVLRGKRIVEIDFGTITAGTSLRGQFEERVRALLSEAANAPEVILFIDEIHTIVGAGKGEGAMDAAQLFKPALARGDVSCIGATTQDEYDRYIRKDPALERRFSPVTVKEMSPEATLFVLQKVAPRIVEKQSAKGFLLIVAPDALQAAVTLTDKYVRERHQPDKAIDAIDIACAQAVVRGTGRITAEDVAKVITDWTGIPAERLTTDKLHHYASMEATLRKAVIGQDAAIACVSKCVRSAMAGLKAPNRPIGVFLFLGPSGVGKTKLAKELAAFLFNTPDALIRFDMSEYQEKHKVSNLLGSARGYIGSEQGGAFTEAMRRRPYSVVLLDEIEKAHPDVFNIFLSVFDDGRTTDNMGRSVDCSNAIFVLTSNIGVGDQLGFGPDQQSDLRSVAAKFLRPELVNRISEVVEFAPLGREELLRIFDRVLREKTVVFSNEHGLSIRVDEAAKELVIADGFDPHMGARPLERAVDRLIVQPLVDAVFTGQVGESEILITAKEGKILLVPAAKEC